MLKNNEDGLWLLYMSTTGGVNLNACDIDIKLQGFFFSVLLVLTS